MRVTFALTALVFLSIQSVSATILTFDGLLGPTGGPIANYNPISQAYGDNVNGPSDGAGSYLMGNAWTPNITTSYRTALISDNSTDVNYIDWWNSNYGDLTNVGFAASASGRYAEIALTAAPGFRVGLNSFDLAGWSQADHTNQTVAVLDGTSNTILFQETNGTIAGAGPSHSHFGSSDGSVRFIGQNLIIRYGYNDWNVGIDNINFDQLPAADGAVPEPATFGLVGLALLAVPLLRRCGHKH